MAIRRKLPAALAVAALASGSGCLPFSCGAFDKACDPVPVPNVADVRYQCSDGRSCGEPRFEPDGGPRNPYQVCPGTSGCATLVQADGTSMAGYC